MQYHQAGRRGWVKQPAVVPQQSSLVPTKLLAAESQRCGPVRRSWFPEFWCWAGGTSAWPSRQADRAYTGCAEFVKHQTHDQSACALSLLPSCYEWPSAFFLPSRVRDWSPTAFIKSLIPLGFYKELASNSLE